MNLSILILTHNRPELFKRCIESVLTCDFSDIDVEIIVNNDSNDINEIFHPDYNIEYSYYSSECLSDLYQVLFNRAKNDYVYFLEDDDYILKDFPKYIDFKHDIYFMEYISVPLIESHGITSQLKMTRQHNHLVRTTTNSSIFYRVFESRYFQLGQILFKRSLIDKLPTGNNIDNDLKLFKSLTGNTTTIRYIPHPTWTQTVDGRDNISFIEYNKDERFCKTV